MERNVIIDNDIGYDWDIMAEFLLAINSTEASIKLFITSDEVNNKRVIFLEKLLEITKLSIPVVPGIDLNNKNFILDDFIDFSKKKKYSNSIDMILSCIEKYKQLIYFGSGSMSNLAKFISYYPNKIKHLKLIQMAGSLVPIYRHGGLKQQYNIRLDPEAFLKVLDSKIEAYFIMSHTTNNKKIEINKDSDLIINMKRIKKEEMKIASKYFDLWYEFSGHGSYLHGPLSYTVALGKKFVKFEKAKFIISDHGFIDMIPSEKERLREKIGAKLSKDNLLKEYLEKNYQTKLKSKIYELNFSISANYSDFLKFYKSRVLGNFIEEKSN